jgi:hypothetical protein
LRVGEWGKRAMQRAGGRAGGRAAGRPGGRAAGRVKRAGSSLFPFQLARERRERERAASAGAGGEGPHRREGEGLGRGGGKGKGKGGGEGEGEGGVSVRPRERSPLAPPSCDLLGRLTSRSQGHVLLVSIISYTHTNYHTVCLVHILNRRPIQIRSANRKRPVCVCVRA